MRGVGGRLQGGGEWPGVGEGRDLGDETGGGRRGACGLGRVGEGALEVGGGRGDRDDVVCFDLLEEERTVRHANPRLRDDPVGAPVIESERYRQQYGVDGDPRRAAWPIR